jgi:hypothetical protein
VVGGQIFALKVKQVRRGRVVLVGMDHALLRGSSSFPLMMDEVRRDCLCGEERDMPWLTTTNCWQVKKLSGGTPLERGVRIKMINGSTDSSFCLKRP